MNKSRSDTLQYLMWVLYLLWLTLPYIQAQCQQASRELHNVPHQNCLCNVSNAGAMRYHDNGLQICNGVQYVNVGTSTQYGAENNPATSCKEILDKNGSSKSGMYYLKIGHAVIEVYCYMENICGSKGWAMIMKIDGSKSTFHYASTQWYSKKLYNIAGAFGGLDEHETKLPTYAYLPFTVLCLGLKTHGGVNWLPFEYTAPSLYSLISDGSYKQTYIGHKAWRDLIHGSSLQTNCTREGINVKVGFGSMARIGILGSNDDTCTTSESRLGFGTGGNRCGQDDGNAAGNEARCGADAGDDKSIKGIGYIFGKDVPAPILGSLSNPASSCLEIKTNGSATSGNGLYYLKLKGENTLVYCHMETICNSSGWTLIMKMYGFKSTFRYSSTYWTSHETYNTDDGIAGGLDDQETKLKTYSNFAFRKLCLGMKLNIATNWISVHYPAQSLYSLIADGKHRKTYEGVQKWKSLLLHSSLQKRCKDEGFNTDSRGTGARIGIIGNNEKHCNSADSRLGFGTAGKRCGQDENNSVGNEAKCNPDNGDTSIRAFGFILAQ